MSDSVRERYKSSSCPGIALLLLTPLASIALADPGYVAPYEEGYARSQVLERRLSQVLDDLLAATQTKDTLHAALKQISLRTPLVSDNEDSPNAYAMPLSSRKLVVFEARFANMLAGGASAAAYYAWFHNNESIGHICKQLNDDDASARARGVQPVFYTELESFPESANPAVLRILELLQASIADDTMIWFLLHEAGHVALNHRPGLPPPDSQKQEGAADRWASQTMRDLGFGLFGPARFLSAAGLMEMCLVRLGYHPDDKQYTHPSWMDRSASMHQDFDVTHTGRGPRRSFAVSTPAGLFWYHIAEVTDDSDSILSGIGPPFRVTAEWQGRALSVYARFDDGTRTVLRIPDADLALLDAEQTTFDSAGRQVGAVERLTAVQMNPAFLDWVEISPGVRVGDAKKKPFEQPIADALVAADVELMTRGRIQLSFRKFRRDSNNAMASFHKGEISKEESMRRLGQAGAEYHRELRSSLSQSQIEVFNSKLDSHPLSSWSPGIEAAHYKRLEDQLIERNFSKGK